MTIQNTQNPTAGAPTNTQLVTAPPNPAANMGTDTFLKLLVAQLKQQDPMDPNQSQDMVTQLSQLTSVEKLTDLDTKMSDLQSGNLQSQGVQSANLIGKAVTADARSLNLTDTTSPSGTYSLQNAAGNVTIQISDSSGNVVRTLNIGAQNGGQQMFQWDGKSDAGSREPAGTYTFHVTAKDNKGIPVPTSTQVSGRVTEVTYENGAPEVVVGSAKIPLADVTSIAQ